MKKIFLLILFVFVNNLFAQNKYFIVNVNIENQNFKLAFDTGAQKTVLFNNKILNAQNADEIGMIGASGDTINGLLSKKKMKIEFLDFNIFEKIQICYLPNELVTLKKLFDIDGLLGNDIISKYDWHLDFLNNNLKILSSSDKKALDVNNFIDVPFERKNNRDYLMFTIQIHKDSIATQLPLLVDLGDISVISLKNQLPYNRKKEFTKITINSTISGDAFSTFDIFTGSFNLANYQLSNIVFTSTISKASNAVGLGFFKLFEDLYILNSKQNFLLKKINSAEIKLQSLGVIDEKIYSMLIPVDKYTKLDDFIKDGKLFNKLGITNEVKTIAVDITEVK